MIDGTERLSIAITDPTLSIADLQRALMQAGYGWFSFTLSRGGMSRHFMLTAEELNALGGYTWDHDFLLKLSGTEK